MARADETALAEQDRDPEVVALEETFAALLPLTREGKLRVIGYLVQRFELSRKDSPDGNQPSSLDHV